MVEDALSGMTTVSGPAVQETMVIGQKADLDLSEGDGDTQIQAAPTALDDTAMQPNVEPTQLMQSIDAAEVDVDVGEAGDDGSVIDTSVLVTDGDAMADLLNDADTQSTPVPDRGAARRGRPHRRHRAGEHVRRGRGDHGGDSRAGRR